MPIWGPVSLYLEGSLRLVGLEDTRSLCELMGNFKEPKESMAGTEGDKEP